MTSLEIIYYYILPILGGLTTWLVMATVYRFQEQKRQKRRTLPNLTDVIAAGREKEVRRIAIQIMSGQHSAIIGAFEEERTSILNALRNPEFYGDKADGLIFSYLDISSLEKDCSQAKFWEYALKPLQAKIGDDTDFVLSQAYKDCQNNHFDNFYLGRLFEQLNSTTNKNELRLVLMLDRFELLLHKDNLNRSDFLANLRTMASRSHSPLNLIIAGNISLWQFYQAIKHLNPYGSPYFNFMESSQITLGALSESEIDELLQQNERPLIEDECRFLKDMTGGHPYLLQVAISALWQAYDSGEKNPIKTIEKTFPDRVKGLLNNLLQSWPQNICQAFLNVAKNSDVSDFKSELEELEKQGFIIKENGAWRVRPKVFLLIATPKG